MRKQIYISDFDLKRFKWLSTNSHKFDELYRKHLNELEMELKDAVIVEPQSISADVITMHSKFRIKDLNTNEEFTYTLVFPFDADLDQNKLSVLAPIGVTVIGCRINDEIEWAVPSGIRKIRIEEILYQPEAAGNFYV